MHDLKKLQRWFQSVVTHPGGVNDGIRSIESRQLHDVTLEEIESVITRSDALSATDRLNVYANAYYARLLECLRGEFPALVQALGEELFDQFSYGYLQEYPSQSYTLGRLGADFARYLDESKPRGGNADSGMPLFLVDLARLEWAVNEAFEAAGPEQPPQLKTDELLAIEPQRWPDARLSTVECLRLLELDHAVNDFYTALRRKETAPPPPREKTWVAICRRDYVVRRHELSRAQYEILSALSGGATIGDAVFRAAEVCGNGPEELSSGLAAWFQSWASAGFFRHVHAPR